MPDDPFFRAKISMSCVASLSAAIQNQKDTVHESLPEKRNFFNTVLLLLLLLRLRSKKRLVVLCVCMVVSYFKKFFMGIYSE